MEQSIAIASQTEMPVSSSMNDQSSQADISAFNAAMGQNTQSVPAYAQEWLRLNSNAEVGSAMYEHTSVTLDAMGIDSSSATSSPTCCCSVQDSAIAPLNAPINAEDFLQSDVDVNALSPEQSNEVTQVVPYSSNGTVNWNSRPVGQLSESQADELGIEVVNRLKTDLNLTTEQAAGVVGNLYYESAGMNPHVNEFDYSGYPAGDPRNYGEAADNVYGYGWAQWTGARKQPFIDFAAANGLDVGSPEHNYQFLVHELTNDESASLVHLQQQATPEDAARSFRTQYERAAFPNDGPRLEQAARFAGMLS